jgi:perosamine synthetase
MLTRPSESVRDQAVAEPTIRFHVPALPDVDAFLEDVRSIVVSGWQSQGRFVRALEEAASPWLGGREVVGVSNCSDGLIAVLATIAKPGGEVILPGFTYLATWQSIVWAGLTPVVVDVDERGLIDVERAEAAISPGTVAILAVHLAGTLAPMRDLRDVADRHGVALVGDAAHAFGASSGDIAAGTLGDYEVFSIGATKQVAAGEGGLVTVRDPANVSRMRLWAGQGHAPGEMDAKVLAMNLRLQEMSAALALRQLADYGAQLDRRALVHDRYRSAWSGLPLRISGPRQGERSAQKDQLVWVDEPGDRQPLRAHLARKGVETRPYYGVAVPDLTAFSGLVSSAERSRALAERSFAVPIHARLSDMEVTRVSDAVRSFYDGGRGGR